MTKFGKTAELDETSHKRMEDAFMATLSHEIRTPLNGILGMASLLAESELSPSQSEYVDAIQESGSRLLDLLNNVLDYARLGTEEVMLEDVRVSPLRTAREVVELLSPRAHARGIDIAACADRGYPSTVMIDGGRLRQILFNLVGNAIKFTDEGGVLLKVSTTSDRLIFSVCDTGPGIPAEKQADLFKAFKQSQSSDSQKDGGVGLGLAIVVQLVTAMGGNVRLESHVGIGSEFIVDLPLIQPQYSERLYSETPHPVALFGLSPVTAWSVTKILTGAGISVTQRDPNASIARMKDKPIALVDATLDEEKIRRIAGQTSCLVLLRPEDRALIPHFQSLGCAGYLLRPLRARSLVAQVEQAALGVPIYDDSAENSKKSSEFHVLVADDNPVNSLLAKRSLEKVGYRCSSAMTGAEALEIVKTMDVDLVLMDLRMPVMDGYQATESIRTFPAPRGSIPIIAVSAEINPDIEAKAYEAGVSAVAAKPLDAERLRTIVGKWCKADNTAAA